MARGTPFLGKATRQGACIYLALEERHEEITADFRAMGATGTEPIRIHADAAPGAAIAALTELVRTDRPALVVIDPLFRLAHVRDEKTYAEVYGAFGPLIDVARETGTHILVTHHSRKSPIADAIDSPLGSTAISGAAATIIALNKRDADRTIQTVTRIGTAMPETNLSFDSDTRTLSIGNTRDETSRLEVEQSMTELLEAGGEWTEPEIDEQVGGANAAKRKALRSLVEKQIVTRNGTGRRNDPFKYSFACTDSVCCTSVQETDSQALPFAQVVEREEPGHFEAPLSIS